MEPIASSPRFCVVILIVMISVAMSLSSCLTDHKTDEYIAFKRIPKSSWSPQDPVCFTFFSSHPQAVHSVQLIVRHDSDYKYTGLKLRTVLRLRDQVIRTDTICAAMATAPLRWRGRGVALVCCKFPIYDGILLEQPGIYTVELSPLLWRSSLGGIETVGLQIWRER